MGFRLPLKTQEAQAHAKEVGITLTLCPRRLGLTIKT